ncbi:MAG: hypothetical protein Q4C61_14680 [Lachnospiraceae bacterium]|nr:hypothetical protein [Lachnospiraceae bacterium]
MFETLKKQVRVLWSDWLWNLALLFGGGVIGFVTFQIVLWRNPGMESYLTLGTIVGGTMAVFFIVIMIMSSIGIYFNVEVSMGCARKHFFGSYFIVSLIECLLGMGCLILLCTAENAGNTILHPGMKNEIDFLPYLLKWSVPAAVVLTVFSLLCGALMIRFGRKAYWILWAIWMAAVLGLPKITDAMSDAPDSVLGRLGNAVGAAVKAVPGTAWLPCMLAASAAGLAAAYVLLHRQQVTS